MIILYLNMNLLLIFNLIIALGIINVWLVRFQKETQWRGGEAKSLKEEFQVYGLPIWFMYIVGFMKITLAILLIIGMWIPKINLYTSMAMIILMIGAVIMHIKVNDPLKKSIPAFSIIILLIGIILNSITNTQIL